MQTGGHLNSRGGELPRGVSVHDDFRAFGITIYLRPRDVRGGAFRHLNIELRLYILYLDTPRIRLVILHSQHQIVLAWGERENDRSLARLLCAVNENVGSRRLRADEDAFGERLELELLVLRLVPFNLQRGLEGLIPLFLYFQAVALRPEIIEAAGRLATAQNVACWSVKLGRRANHVGDHVNGSASGRGNRVAAFTASTPGCIVVFNVIDDVHACGRIAQKLQEIPVLGGAELPGQSQRVGRPLNLRASRKSLFGAGFSNSAFVLLGFGCERAIRSL